MIVRHLSQVNGGECLASESIFWSGLIAAHRVIDEIVDTLKRVEGLYEMMDDLQIEFDRLLETLVKLSGATLSNVETPSFNTYPPSSKNPEVFCLGKYQVFRLDIIRFITGLEKIPDDWTNQCNAEEAEFLVKLVAELILTALNGVINISIICGNNKGRKCNEILPTQGLCIFMS